MTDLKDLASLASTPADETYTGAVLQVGSERAVRSRFQRASVYIWHRTDEGRTCLVVGQDGDFCRVPWLSQESCNGILTIRSKSGGVWRLHLGT